MIYRFIIIILFCSIFYSCHKIKYYPDKDYHEVKTLILAHKAGGGEPAPYQAYSIEAAKNSLPVLDGIEVDLQISKDRTIWLSHDASLPDCGGTTYNCFPEATDNQIIQLDTCNGNALNYTGLEEIFALMSSNYPGKYVSLDVKAWEPCALTSADILGMMNVIADEIIRLTNKYSMQNHVMVESETATFLNYVKNNSTGIECYLTSLGDFERAMQLTLEAGYTGISFKYKFKEEITLDHIQLIRRKGLKIQLWTVDSTDAIQEALSINPDFIQTDNVGYFEQLK
jgi:glycerophosphoryl diester phosphodiesterase